MYRYKITVEYDGMGFECGWQKQPNQISVQGVLEQSISKAIYGAEDKKKFKSMELEEQINMCMQSNKLFI